jgi:hypothetical protein
VFHLFEADAAMQVIVADIDRAAVTWHAVSGLLPTSLTTAATGIAFEIMGSSALATLIPALI